MPKKVAQEIVVDHDRHVLEIDGVEFAFHIADAPLVAHEGDGLWSVTVKVYADHVEQILTAQ